MLLLHGRDGLTWADLKYRPLARELAGQGFVVCLLHYFGAPRPARDVTDVPQFMGWVERVEAAITHAASAPRVDPRRVGLVGVSLGGYLALAVAPRASRPSSSAAAGYPRRSPPNSGACRRSWFSTVPPIRSCPSARPT